MRRYSTRFQQSAVFGAFLRQRAWAFGAALKFPLLAILPFAIYFCVWWVMVPSLVVVPPALAFGLIDPQFIAPALVVGFGLLFFTMLPVFVTLLLDSVPGYFACAALMFGSQSRATAMRAVALSDLNDWNAERV